MSDSIIVLAVEKNQNKKTSCLDISDLTMSALRLTAEYVRPNNSPICLFVLNVFFENPS